ncbi:hypothetical protein BJ912DRAFT_1137994 [Pholiota molesta]|nr:hypothetical protein BJ912DRAFT_1137994 [Pholiota molesta]
MVRISTLLAAVTGFLVASAASATGNPVVESRDTCATFPLTPTSIIDAIEAVGLFKDMTVPITIQSLTTNTVSIIFDIQNPLPVELTLDNIAANAGLNGTVLATFTQSFSPPGFVVPALGTASGTFNDVVLPQGAVGLLAIIPYGVLDLSSIDASSRVLTSSGTGGIAVPLDGLTQSVTTEYAISSCSPP